jgi:hypothetical protein
MFFFTDLIDLLSSRYLYMSDVFAVDDIMRQVSVCFCNQLLFLTSTTMTKDWLSTTQYRRGRKISPGIIWKIISIRFGLYEIIQIKNKKLFISGNCVLN